jgi:hypothetical protein
MTITLEYRDPSSTHCTVVVFINGANTGQLRLRQEELVTFQLVLQRGLSMPGDAFLARGNPNAVEAS